MKFTKILSFVLVLLTLLTSCIACKDSTQDDPNSTGNGQTQATTPSVTEPGEAKSDQTVGDLEQETISILAWGDAEMQEFEYDEKEVDQVAINDAILKRNTAVEERLNCQLKFIYEKGSNSQQETYLKRAEAISNGDENDFVDIFASYSMTTALVSTKGLCENLIPLQKENSLNFEHQWWPATMVKEAMFENALYVCTGDISTNLLWMMETVYFNKDLYESIYGQGTSNELYDLVKEGKWTVDKLYELCNEVYVDTDSDQTKSSGDTFGYVVAWQGFFDDFYVGAGFTMCERDDTNNITLSKDWGGETEDTFARNFIDFTKTDDFWYANAGAYSGVGVDAFATGRALFTNNRARMAKTFRETATCEYGILPMPKFNEAQENYSTNLGFPYTLYAISNCSQSVENAALVLESMAAQSYEEITPVLFYDALQLRYSPEVQDANTFDILRSTICFDIGRIYCTPLSNYSWNHFRNACTSGSYKYTTSVSSVKKLAQILLDTLKEDLRKNEG